jgi:murein tripeptide amidase MpaA
MWVTANFDGGNSEILAADDPRDVQLRVRREPPTVTSGGTFAHGQHFAVRVLGAAGVPLRLRWLDMDTTSYPAGWKGYRATVQDGDGPWTRAETRFNGRELEVEVTPRTDVLTVAYFPLYPLERVDRLVARAAKRARVDVVATSLQGRPLPRLRVGEGPRPVWVIARQHPGESMASWWMEGFVARLVASEDALAAAVRARATVHVVPLMNPDGAYAGHLRTNAAGINLNRCWDGTDAAQAPEVAGVRAAMVHSGVFAALDVHGDEEIPVPFGAGADGIVGWTPAHRARLDAFRAAYVAANPDFQTAQGYPTVAPESANTRICTPWVAATFDALAVTLELPFKDDPRAPGVDPAARAMALGRDALAPLLADLDRS